MGKDKPPLRLSLISSTTGLRKAGYGRGREKEEKEPPVPSGGTLRGRENPSIGPPEMKKKKKEKGKDGVISWKGAQ